MAVGAAVGILGITAAAGPLFLSSAGTAAVQRGLAAECPWRVSLRSSSQTLVFGDRFFQDESFESVDRRVRGVARGLPHVGSVQWQIISDTIPASAGGSTEPVKFYARPGALAHVRKLGTGVGRGVWISDRTARGLNLAAGDRFSVTTFEGSLEVPVAGIYRDLASLPRSSFWCGQGQNIYPIGDALPPALVLTDLPTLQSATSRGRAALPVQTTWVLPVVPRDLTLSDARDLSAAFEAAKPLVAIHGFSDVQLNEELPLIVGRAAATVDALRASVDTIALAGSLVALLVVAGAAVFWVHRRRSEVGVLASKGFGPPAIGLKVLLEALPMAVVGAVAGWAAAIALVKTLGPSRLLERGVSAQALVRVGWITGLGVIVLACVGAAVARRDTEPLRPWRRSWAGAPWEVAILLLAAASLYEVMTRGPVRTDQAGVPKVDILILLFPILFLAGGAGLASRAIHRTLPVLRRAGEGWRPSLYLASRRLAGAPRIALSLLTATGIAIGILAYAGILSASVLATSDAKTKVFTGSDLAVTLAEEVPIPASIASRATTVSVSENAYLLPQQDPVDLLGVDPATFARAAFWDPSFAGPSLADLLKDLGGPADTSGPLRVLATQDLAAGGGTLLFRGGPPEVSFRVVATLRAFPGMTSNHPLVVALRGALAARKIPSYPAIWASGNADSALEALRAAGAPILITVTAREAERTPAFLALAWTFGFLQALGLVIGLIVLGGILLYLEAYQRTRAISFALAGRMGLSEGQHRASVGLELVAMLASGSLLGIGLAWSAARLVYRKLDLLPTHPPPPLFRTPIGLLGLTLVAVAAASWLGAWGVQRAAERANVTEVIRVAG